jgi:hypothetical protein
MAYSMVKACKLGCCHMTAREAAKFPILLPGKSQSGEKLRVELRHLAFNTAMSLEWLGLHILSFLTRLIWYSSRMDSDVCYQSMARRSILDRETFFNFQFTTKVVFHRIIDLKIFLGIMHVQFYPI